MSGHFKEIPLLDKVIAQLEKQLSSNKYTGFIYFEIANSRKIKDYYGEKIYEDLVSNVNDTLLNFCPSLL
ncbi:MAG TPA: hypothetical protein PL110_15440, partial [Candidatus Eremiobacteraeota bacterium]|nr:hypothetical protein [Candidatus Eremiobacteraeota bacterium]